MPRWAPLDADAPIAKNKYELRHLLEFDKALEASQTADKGVMSKSINRAAAVALKLQSSQGIKHIIDRLVQLSGDDTKRRETAVYAIDSLMRHASHSGELQFEMRFGKHIQHHVPNILKRALRNRSTRTSLATKFMERLVQPWREKDWFSESIGEIERVVLDAVPALRSKYGEPEPDTDLQADDQETFQPGQPAGTSLLQMAMAKAGAPGTPAQPQWLGGIAAPGTPGFMQNKMEPLVKGDPTVLARVPMTPRLGVFGVPMTPMLPATPGGSACPSTPFLGCPGTPAQAPAKAGAPMPFTPAIGQQPNTPGIRAQPFTPAGPSSGGVQPYTPALPGSAVQPYTPASPAAITPACGAQPYTPAGPSGAQPYTPAGRGAQPYTPAGPSGAQPFTPASPAIGVQMGPSGVQPFTPASPAAMTPGIGQQPYTPASPAGRTPAVQPYTPASPAARTPGGLQPGTPASPAAMTPGIGVQPFTPRPGAPATPGVASSSTPAWVPVAGGHAMPLTPGLPGGSAPNTPGVVGMPGTPGFMPVPGGHAMPMTPGLPGATRAPGTPAAGTPGFVPVPGGNAAPQTPGALPVPAAKANSPEKPSIAEGQNESETPVPHTLAGDETPIPTVPTAPTRTMAPPHTEALQRDVLTVPTEEMASEGTLKRMLEGTPTEGLAKRPKNEDLFGDETPMVPSFPRADARAGGEETPAVQTAPTLPTVPQFPKGAAIGGDETPAVPQFPKLDAIAGGDETPVVHTVSTAPMLTPRPLIGDDQTPLTCPMGDQTPLVAAAPAPAASVEEPPTKSKGDED